MFAVVRESTYDPAKLTGGSAELARYQVLRAGQAGYQGNLVVDLGNGRILTITLYDTPEQATAAQSAMQPEAQRLLEPMMTAATRVVGTGPVIITDLRLSEPHEWSTDSGKP